MKYIVSNVKKYQKTRGWLCGHFMPEGSILKTNKLEVKYGELKPGGIEKEHFHPKGEELFIVIKGKMKVVIEEEEFLLEKGDFIFEKAKTNEAIIEVLEPTTIIAVRTPSVPENKIYVE